MAIRTERIEQEIECKPVFVRDHFVGGGEYISNPRRVITITLEDDGESLVDRKLLKEAAKEIWEKIDAISDN